MKALLTHVAGMDVHQKSIVVCVVVGAEGDEPETEIRTFPTMTRDLFEMLRWLEEKGVTHIAMESTGIYWKPVYNILEGYFDITLANAQRIKNVPGRKTDVSDSEWIARLLRYGLIEPSFVLPPVIRELRDLTRLRKKWVGYLTKEKNRIQKVLECSNIKLSSVISDVFGVSGRNLLACLIEQGYIEPDEIEKRVKGPVKRKVVAISESLFGTLTEHQIFLIRHSWNHIMFIEQSIQELDQKIDELLQSFQEEMEIIQSMPGMNRLSAASVLAEIGTDMNQFPSAAHLSSWAGVSPGNNESAGKKKSTRIVKGNPHIRTTLCEAAWAVARSRNNRFATKYWKLAARRGKKKALIAIAHNMLVVLYHLLNKKERYVHAQLC
jgi:transposase